MKSSFYDKIARLRIETRRDISLLAVMVVALVSPRSNAQDIEDQILEEPIAAGARGFTFTSTASGDHDSTSWWSSVLDTSARYDFNRVFGVELGVPYYMSHTGFDSTKLVAINKN